KAAGIQREIAKQRCREQNEDAEIDQRQLESGGAKEFAKRRHVNSSQSQRNRLPKTPAKYAARPVGWRPRRGAAPRGESCPRSFSAIPRIQAGGPAGTARASLGNGGKSIMRWRGPGRAQLRAQERLSAPQAASDRAKAPRPLRPRQDVRSKRFPVRTG